MRGHQTGDLGVDGRRMLKSVLEKRCELVDWINVAQNGIYLAGISEDTNESSVSMKSGAASTVYAV